MHTPFPAPADGGTGRESEGVVCPSEQSTGSAARGPVLLCAGRTNQRTICAARSRLASCFRARPDPEKLTHLFLPSVRATGRAFFRFD